VINQHPFTIVEEPSFIELVHSLCLNAELFSADTIKRKIMELYNGNISQIQKFLQETPGKLSFTMDIWTSPSAKAFLAITTHYIDKNWKLQNILVDFIQIFGSHSGENIKDAFVTGLQNLSIQNKVIFLFLFLLYFLLYI
jgi:archaellum biogenesis ATPase FlaH